jgi:Tol biopolymer transport system component
VYSLLRSHVSIARLAADATIPERVIHSVGSDRAPHDEAKAPGPVFVSRRTGSAELWLAPRSGSGERQLTRLDGLAAAPAWSPDGRHIAFLGSCGPARRYGVCSLDATDGTLRPLTTDAAEYGWPAWHPDGRSVWVTSERGGRWQLWRLDAQSGSAEPVPTEQAPGRALAWAGDGSAIVYEERDSRRLRWRPIGSGAERALATTPGGAALVDWRLGPGGLVTLTRSDRERIERVDPATGRRTPWAERPLGTFPERARLAWTADGALLIEVADAATADLMQLR